MSIVEVVSLVMGSVGTTLAGVAIFFAWRVHTKDNDLNVTFTRNLSQIQQLSSETNRMVASSIDRLVDEFFRIQGSTSNLVSETDEQGDSAEPSLADIKRQIDAIQEAQKQDALRWRITDTSIFTRGFSGTFVNDPVTPNGTTVRVTNETLRSFGKIGVIDGHRAQSDVYKVFIDGNMFILQAGDFEVVGN